MSLLSMTSENGDRGSGNIVSLDTPTRRAQLKHAFAQRLVGLMMKRGWTQSELGRHAGITRGQINVYVKERSLPSPLHLQALARALDTTEDYLVPKANPGSVSALNDNFYDTPVVDVRLLPDGDWRVRLDVVVSTQVMNTILQLVHDNQASDAE